MSLSFKRIIVGLACIVGLLFVAHPAAAVVIDFEGGAEGDILGTISGATFNDAKRVVPGDPLTAFDGNSSGTGAGGVDDANSGNTATSTTGNGLVSVTFASAVSGLTLDVADIERASTGVSESFTAQIFDALVGGTVLDTIVIDADTPGTGDGTLVTADFSSFGGVRRLEFSESLGSADTISGYAIDNLTFEVTDGTTSDVPEAGTLAILSLGLAVLGCARRKRRA